ncbi:hypothetical protein [Flavobacterium sp. UBA7663]|uniref:hypothetical protein n=1 Tax=Flavobacterium sp. UBA7663 TaxID=1946557 RepID=UPI0025C1DAA5|nr:hypothetical protein [Flavobacterium sp. UBA7663]
MAFAFFKDSIIKNDSISYKVNKNLLGKYSPDFEPECLKSFNRTKVLKVEKKYEYLSYPTNKISNFYLKNPDWAIPSLKVSKSYSNKRNMHFVFIDLNFSSSGFIYFLELNEIGKVLNWCKLDYIE